MCPSAKRCNWRPVPSALVADAGARGGTQARARQFLTSRMAPLRAFSPRPCVVVSARLRGGRRRQLRRAHWPVAAFRRAGPGSPPADPGDRRFLASRRGRAPIGRPSLSALAGDPATGRKQPLQSEGVTGLVSAVGGRRKASRTSWPAPEPEEAKPISTAAMSLTGRSAANGCTPPPGARGPPVAPSVRHSRRDLTALRGWGCPARASRRARTIGVANGPAPQQPAVWGFRTLRRRLGRCPRPSIRTSHSKRSRGVQGMRHTHPLPVGSLARDGRAATTSEAQPNALTPAARRSKDRLRHRRRRRAYCRPLPTFEPRRLLR